MNYKIQSNTLAVVISSLGAEMISAVGADGYEYIWQNESGEFWKSHAPILFPHCGRILNSEYTYEGKRYEMGIHGFARKQEFELVSASDCEIVLTLKSTEETKKIYPFDFELIAEYKVNGNNLYANFTVKNTDEKEMPYMFGWHPGFNLECVDGKTTEDYYIEFDGVSECICHPLQNGAFVCPTGKPYSLPNCRYHVSEEEMAKEGTMIFVGTGSVATLSTPNAKHNVELSYSNNLPYFCIWKWESEAAKYICLEPWSDVPGPGDVPEVFETKKMSHLTPNSAENYQYKIKFS